MLPPCEVGLRPAYQNLTCEVFGFTFDSSTLFQGKHTTVGRDQTSWAELHLFANYFEDKKHIPCILPCITCTIFGSNFQEKKKSCFVELHF